MKHKLQLSRLLKNTAPSGIMAHVRGIYEKYPAVNTNLIGGVFSTIMHLFAGNFRDFAACTTLYHDLTHTMEVFLAAARIMDGYCTEHPDFSAEMVENCLIAALLHDAGYITKETDVPGSGAKYTESHVERGIEFLRGYHDDLHVSEDRIESIARMIQATHISFPFADIPFSSDAERDAAAILGTADLVGQMSSRNYLERLLYLYYEFREASVPGYNTEFDILAKTLDFYTMAEKRITETLMNVSRYARIHFREQYGIDAPLYQEAIDGQISHLKRILNDESSNFRHKLHRHGRS